ncbi:FGGY-family carbohydrate kinase [Pelagibius sp.]|uniref:FGGY-family carbohydrate kinase n=1 Tax=Pelagibius sp. TaxID=1931238 RepID=UPI0026070D2D|nr:FGGY-family carbohydrate kinase [Pelagibius sp.]
MSDGARYLGIDLGTSGVRVVLTDDRDRILTQLQAPLPQPDQHEGSVRQDPALWWRAVDDLLERLGTEADLARVAALAVDGTSGTILLCDAAGDPLAPARMYNDRSAVDAGRRIDAVAPDASMARGTGGALARLLGLLEETGAEQPRFALHQADWIAGRLTGRYGQSDFNNCLKLGFDAVAQTWPAWMAELDFDLSLLPQVEAAGQPLASLRPNLAQRYGLPAGCLVVRGTTDGNAAFLAAGSFEPGLAVTSLGSTLTVKLVSADPVFAPEFGVYSHRLLGHWLAGGASNTGGAAIAQHFSVEALEHLTPRLRPEVPTGLSYYPLPAPGERFPLADPEMQPLVSPRPEDDAVFLQGLLEGVAQIEQEAYALLASLGATPVTRVLTVGGGAANEAWTRIRERVMGVPVDTATQTEAAYGTARLARLGFEAKQAAPDFS